MKQTQCRFWYSLIFALLAIFPVHANMDSYSISTAPKDISSHDITLDSFKSSTSRALKIAKPEEDQELQPSDSESVESIPLKKKGRLRKKIESWLDPKNRKKTLRTMNYAELEDFKNRALAAKDRYNAIRILERMVPICTDLEKLKNILLELADLLFDDGKLEAAGKMYREFVKYYPGNEKVEYSLYKAIICKFYVILDAERDQTATRDTVELANKFLEREEIFTTHSQEVQSIRSRCYDRLFDSEINVFNFYCSRMRYKSAKTRLANIRKEFMPLIPACDPLLVTLEIQLAQLVNDAPLLEIKKKELTERFPDYKAPIVAKAKKHSSLDRL